MKKLLKLNHIQQTTDYTCGPASLLTFLDYHDKKLCKRYTEKKLAKLLKTCPQIGTSSSALYDRLEKSGKKFHLIKSSTISKLEKDIDKEKPSLVLWHDGDEWHWSSVVGYDRDNIILLDPYLQDGYNRVNKKDFSRRWSKLAIK